MKKSVRIFEILKTKLHTKEFMDDYRQSPKAFLRHRLLPFPIILLFILNLLRKSIPKELNSFCNYLKTEKVSRSAITQARAKISAEAFVKLNNILIEEFYGDNDFLTFQNFIVLAMDGSTLQLPDAPKVLEKYGFISNNTTEIMPAARISLLYDVLNGLILNAQLKPYKSDEREMAIAHIEAIQSLNIDFKKILIIFDRGYPSLALIYYLRKKGINFLIRCGRGFIKEINEFLKSKNKDVIIKITPKRLKQIPKAKREICRLYPEFDFNEDIVFRALIIQLETGEKEILLTSLICKENYPYNIFKELYFKRWGIEENYKFIKGIEMENFSGKSTLALEQDFHATILVANSHALLVLESQKEIVSSQQFIERNYELIEKKSESNDSLSQISQRKYEYCINKRVSIEGLKNEFVRVLLDPHSDVEAFCIKIKQIMRHDLIPKRPGRNWRRLRKNTRRKYHMNQR